MLGSDLTKYQYGQFINHCANRNFITKNTGNIIENIRHALVIASVFLEGDLHYLIEKATNILLRLESVDKALLTSEDFKFE